MATNKAPSPLAAGTVVGGRFVLGETVASDAIGWVHSARDQKTHKPIALRVLPASLLGPEGQKALRAECRTASGLAHRSIVATYGVGAHESGAPFVATEWVDGTSLAALVKARAAEGRQLSLRGSYNVLAHVCKALSYAQAKTCHGALRPSTVWVGGGGRVKVGEFGLAKAVIGALGPAALGEGELAWLAPEVKAGKAPDDRSDIFGLGAVLYQLLTGRSPADGFVPPSQAHPDATPEIDQILLRCLAADPASRFGSPDDVRTALLPLVANAPEVSAEEEFGFEVDIDVDLASVRPPPPAGSLGPTPALPAPATTPRESLPRVGTRVSHDQSFRAAAADADDRPSVATLDLTTVLTRITENDAPRWMVTKNGLDHGPFSGRELATLIAKGEYLRGDRLLNMDTGERCELGAHADFAELAHQHERERRDAEHAAATAVAVKAEARSGAFKAAVALGIIGALVAAGAIFFLTRQARREEEVRVAEVGDLYRAGQIDITGTAGILPTPRRGHGRSAGSGGGGGGAAGSYEEAMNRAVDIGDATGGGSERVLSTAQVATVMNGHIGRIYAQCVPAEQRRGGSLGRVQLDIAIQRDGRVMGTSARQGSAEFKTCIARAVSGVRFPSFGAPRMGARYTFAVD